jgi:hypothetical protein
MLHYLPQLSLSELNDLFLCEAKRFVEALESNVPHNEIAAIRKSVKQIIAEIEKRKKVNC